MRPVKGGRYRVLSSEQVYDIHSASLEVLERTGVTVKAEEGLKLLDEAGAIVDYKSGRVRLPEHLVRESIRKAPSR
ncbi:MAG: trimethylamine methyltransferase family protein, partial [Candidatus Heimdallarchaeota archaeon]